MRPRHSGPRKKERKTFKNDQIKAFKIIVIDENGENLGSMPRAKALGMSEEKGLDLVQLSYNPEEKVATAKIVDYGKYMYDKQKKESDKKKTQKVQGQKEIKFGYNIGQHDLEMKLKKAQEFLEKGYAVKLMSVLRGREKAYRSLAREKFEHIVEALSEYGRPQGIKQEQFGFVLVVLSKNR